MTNTNYEAMHKSLHELMGEDYSNCCGTTKEDGYLAFYHQRGLYSVEHEESGIVSLVYAKNPYEAIELIDIWRCKGGAYDIDAVVTYIERVANSGTGKKKSLEYIKKFVKGGIE